jgi:hypothetical protein
VLGRDFLKAALNKRIAAMTAELKAAEAHVMNVHRKPTAGALHEIHALDELHRFTP